MKLRQALSHDEHEAMPGEHRITLKPQKLSAVAGTRF
jgi:hypothetical protein